MTYTLHEFHWFESHMIYCHNVIQSALLAVTDRKRPTIANLGRGGLRDGKTICCGYKKFHRAAYLIRYDDLSNYFSLEIVSVAEFPEEHRMQVSVTINIWMDRESAGELVQKCLNMQDK